MKDRGHKWSQSTVWSVERGDRPLRLTEAEDLAAILGVEVAMLTKEPFQVGLNRFYNRLEGSLLEARAALEYAAVAFNHWRQVLQNNAEMEMVGPYETPADRRAGLAKLAEESAADVVTGDLSEGLARFEAEQHGYAVTLNAKDYLEHVLGEHVDWGQG